MAGTPRAALMGSPPAKFRWVRGGMAMLVGSLVTFAGVGPAAVGPAGAQESPSWPSFQGGPAHLGSASGIEPGFRSEWRVAPEGDARLSVPAIGSGLAVSV